MEPITTEECAVQIKQMVKDFKRKSGGSELSYHYHDLDDQKAWWAVEVENPSEQGQGYVYLRIGDRINVEQAFPGIDQFDMKTVEHGDDMFRGPKFTYVTVPCTHDSVLQINKIHRKIYIDEAVEHLKRILAEYQTSINDENVFRFLVNKGLNECGFGLARYKGPEEVCVDDIPRFGVIKSFFGSRIFLQDKLGEAEAKDAFVEVVKKALPQGMRVEKVNQLGG